MRPDGDTDYTFTDSDKKEVGTTITLHVNADGEEFLAEHSVTSSLRNFCDFMLYKIDVLDEEKKPEKPRKEDGTEDEEAEAVLKPITINNCYPISLNF